MTQQAVDELEVGPRQGLTLVPALPETRTEASETPLYNETLERTGRIAEAVTQRHERKLTSNANNIVLRRISRLRAQVEFITSNMRAHGIEPPVDDGYISHDDVMTRVAELNLDERQADISRADASSIHEAFDTTAHRGEMIRYNPDNPYFRDWVEQEHPEDHDYMIRFQWVANSDVNGYRSERLHTDTKPERFMQLFEEWVNTPESVRLARIVELTSQKLELENIGTLNPEELAALRKKLSHEARSLLNGNSLTGWADDELPSLDAKIDYFELQIARLTGSEDVARSMLDAAVAELQDIAPSGVDSSTIEQFVIRRGASDTDYAAQKQAARAYLETLENYLDDLQTQRDQANLSHAALKLVAS